jgi:hypothetical protein
MLSIERDDSKPSQDRFNDNKPFAAIAMDFRESSKVLPNLLWDKPTYVWLDYDDPIAKGMLYDVQTVSTNAMSGTVLAVTVQCHRAQEAPRLGQESNEGEPSPIEKFRDRLGVAAVGSDVSEEDLLGWPFGELSRKIFADQIEAALAVRNLEVEPEEKMAFVPICDIEYMDGPKMTTLVGIFAKAHDMPRVHECGFDTLDFLPSDSRLLRIEVPILTIKEIRDLERQLPLTSVPLACGSIPQDHAENFKKFYRYFPNFAVLEQ